MEKQVHLIDHPLIEHKISLLRDKETSTKDFKDIVKELSMLLAYELTRNLPTKEIEMDTPLGIVKTKVIVGRELTLVPIMRAGLGMVDGFLALLPFAKVGHIGIYKDPTSKEAVLYYKKFPNTVAESDVFVLEPMLSSGVTAVRAAEELKKAGCGKIRFVTLLAAPEGLRLLTQAHPDVEIYCASIGLGTDEKGYIVPGFGDAGDRMFGTR